MKNRRLKVREGHRDYLLKTFPGRGNPTIPFVLLKGTWLDKAGFTIGLPITVRVKNQQLIITPEIV